MFSKFFSLSLFIFLCTSFFQANAFEEVQNQLSFDLQDNDLEVEDLLKTMRGRPSVGDVSRHRRYRTYDIYYSHEKKFIWFCVYKVASLTILNILKEQVPDLQRTRKKVVPERMKDYFKFAFVRNPWDRIVSCYFNKVTEGRLRDFKACKGKDFDCFVDLITDIDLRVANPHIKLQTCLIPIQECDFIGKLENFSTDLQYISSVIGIKIDNLPHYHKTERAHYSTYYTPKTRRIIEKKYRKDIQTFGYEFETQ
jgi:hypothetical protein